MNKLVLESYGKINLGLDVLYKKENGYHEINTIMQEISLRDIVTLKNIDEKHIIIESNKREMPLASENLAYKAWEAIKEKTKIDRGIYIKIEKNIPLAAGLAGGSSNGAAVLKGLNQLWDLGLSKEELRDMGKELGADIPYCLLGGTAQAKGIGEKLESLKSFSGKDLLLINSGLAMSTEDVYKKLDLKNRKAMDIKKIKEALEEENLEKLESHMTNIMETVAIGEKPIIGEIKKHMLEYGAKASLMTGSGPTVFGLFENEEKLDYCKEKLEKIYEKALIIKCKTR